MTNLATNAVVKAAQTAVMHGITPEMGMPERVWTYLPLATQRGATVAELAMLKEVFPMKEGESEQAHRNRVGNVLNSMARRNIIHKKDEVIGSELVTLFRRKGRSRPAFKRGYGDGMMMKKASPVKLVSLHRAPPAASIAPTLSVIPSSAEVTDVEVKPSKAGKSRKAMSGATAVQVRGRKVKAAGGTQVSRSESQAWPVHAAVGVRPMTVTPDSMKGEIVEARVQVLIRGNHYSVQEARLVYEELKQMFE